MNKLEPTSLIMSGVESSTYFDIAMSAGIRRVLMSFLYMQRKGKKFLRERIEKYPDVKIMVDSGAFTFLTKEEYQNKPIEYWEKYLDKYSKFLLENKEHIFSCVELDLQNLVGEAQIDKWREQYFKPLEEEGILVCYVWHGEDLASWKKMCQKFRYVGFSLQTSNLSDTDVIKMLNIAKLNNAIVHGFANTQIDLLTKAPFYSTDSVTWLVGTKYGELNWFDGRKWIRLKKDKWKRQYKTKFKQLGANWDLLEKENPYELIRVNLLVFKKAEEYIRKRLRAKMYWLKEGGENVPKKKQLKKVVVKPPSEEVIDVEVIEKPRKKLSIKKGVPEREDLKGKTKFEEFEESIVEDTSTIFKDLEWFNSDALDYEVYAKELNIDIVDMIKEDALDLLWTVTVFLNHFEEIKDRNSDIFISDEEINNLYEQYFEDFIDDVDLKREKLREMWETDINNTLPEEAKERDNYLEEEEFLIYDIDEAEINMMLPAMPEVDAYDTELNNHGIDIVRDEQGRFLKGQQKVRKPKNVYSEKYPKLICDTCYKAGDCPHYQEGYVCVYDKLFKRFDTRDTEDVYDAMVSMANMNLERLQRMAMFELMDGGMADPNVSALISQNVQLLNSIKDLSKANMVASQRKVINSDGSMVIENELRTNPGQGSILEKLFMNDNLAEKDVEEGEKDE